MYNLDKLKNDPNTTEADFADVINKIFVEDDDDDGLEFVSNSYQIALDSTAKLKLVAPLFGGSNNPTMEDCINLKRSTIKVCSSKDTFLLTIDRHKKFSNITFNVERIVTPDNPYYEVIPEDERAPMTPPPYLDFDRDKVLVALKVYVGE